MESFGLDIAQLPSLDVGTDEEVIDRRRADVTKQDREHHAFRVCRIQDADHQNEETDQEPVNVLTFDGHGSGDGVRRHEDHTERKTT